MPEQARAPLHTQQTIALIESSPLSSSSWEALADKARRENDPLSIKSLEIIIRGLKQIEEVAAADPGPSQRLSEFSQSMFVRLARAYNSPTLLKEVGLIYLRDLQLPAVALEHFERSLLLGGPEKELRPLTEAAAVAVQRQIARRSGEEPQLSGMSSARPLTIVATTILRRTGRMLLPRSLGNTAALPRQDAAEADKESSAILPATTDACLAEADEAIGRGSLQRAEALLRKANENPAATRTMWQAWTHLGQAAFERDDFPRVESAFSEALKHQPEDMAAHFNAGLGHHLNQHFDQALSAYTRADELQARNAKVWCNLGALYFQMDDYERAEEALRDAVKMDPGYARAWDNFAASLGAQDKLDHALAACERALDLRPAYPEVRFKMGVIHFSRNQWPEAQEEFGRAAILPSLAAYCETFLAMIHARLGQTGAAEAAAQRATHLDPKSDLLWMAWNDLGLAWLGGKDYAQAARAYEKATELKPDESGAWFNLGASLQQSGNLTAARKAYQRAIDLKESLAEAWHNLGIICAETGDLPGAAAAFRRETTWAPANVRAWHDLGVVSEQLDLHGAAREAFAKSERPVRPESATPEGSAVATRTED